MLHLPTSTKRSFCAKLADKKAIRESLAPLAPFPEELNKKAKLN